MTDPGSDCRGLPAAGRRRGRRSEGRQARGKAEGGGPDLIAAVRTRWLAEGLPYGELWDLTLREAFQVIEGRQAYHRARFEERRVIAYEAARLGYYAYHAPKKMPIYRPMDADGGGTGGASRAVQEAEVRGRLMALAMANGKPRSAP